MQEENEMHWTRQPPIKMWAQALRWGMNPEKIIEAIKGWVEAH